MRLYQCWGVRSVVKPVTIVCGLSSLFYHAPLVKVGVGGLRPVSIYSYLQGESMQSDNLLSAVHDYASLMDESRRKPTTGTPCPTLLDKWYGIFYMPSRTAGYTKAFHW